MRRNSKNEPPDLSIMLLGSTGAGKSASGNTILNRAENPFEEDFSPETVTRICQSEQTEVDGQTIRVIDTVGLSDTEVRVTDAQTQIEEMLQRTNDGIDVFLLVIKLEETFANEKIKVVKWIQDNFGAKALKHTMVLFTHEDQLHGTIESYLSKCEALRSVVDQCSGRFHVFNNKDKDPSQVTELLEKIESLKINNSYKRYTEQDYKKTQKELLLKKCATKAAAGRTSGGANRGRAPGGGAAGGGAAGGGAAGGGAAGGGAAAVVLGGAALVLLAMRPQARAALAALTAGIGTGGIAVLAAAIAVAGTGVILYSRKKLSEDKNKSN